MRSKVPLEHPAAVNLRISLDANTNRCSGVTFKVDLVREGHLDRPLPPYTPFGQDLKAEAILIVWEEEGGVVHGVLLEKELKS